MALFEAVIVGTLYTGALYILIGLSQVIVFRATKVLNLAAGAFSALGAYVSYGLCVSGHLPIIVAILLSLLVMALLGAVTNWVLLPVLAKPLFVPATASLGISLVLLAVLDIIWGSVSEILPSPLPNITWHPFGTPITFLDVSTMVVAGLLVVGYLALERYTLFGVRFRASADDPVLAELAGLKVAWLNASAWALGSVAAVFAGLTFAYTALLTPNISNIGLAALAPLVIVGFSSVGGLVPACLLVAFVQYLTEAYVGAQASSAVVYLVLLIILLVKPTGFFGTGHIQRV